MFGNFFKLFILLGSFSRLFATPGEIVPAVQLKATGYQKWAHLHWAWLHNGQGNQENVTNFVNGWEANNIPLGAINIDSTWATEFNNFVVNTVKFPDFPGLIKDMHDRGLKVILWATSMVNVENPDYDMCVEKGYLVRNSHGMVRPIQWWHGSGALLDYTNPEAVEWWHGNMNKVLDVGVDGFKCDGTDPYIMEYMLTGGALGYQDQKINYREYAYAYYRDFLYHTRERRSPSGKNGDAGLIMSRPVDCELDQASKLCTPFSPRDVMVSGWVGDDDASFRGMEGCLRKVIYSAWMGYGGMGCDIGGYRGSDPKDRQLFIRWAQLGAFMPLMENGGGGEHRPWMYDEEVTDIYRKFAVQHHRLATYLHNAVSNGVDSNTSSIHPVDAKQIPAEDIDMFHIVYPQPKTYSYRLGNDVLVHPIVFNELNQTDANTVHMEFPEEAEGTSAVWLDWWEPNNMRRSYKSGDKHIRNVPFDSYAVYVREGSFLPLHDSAVEDSETPLVNMDRYTFTWFHPSKTATATNPAQIEMRESMTTGTGITTKAYFTGEDSIYAEITSHPGAVALELVGVTRPEDVKVESFITAGCRKSYDIKRQSARVQCTDGIGGMRIQFTGVKASRSDN
jgi:alpha-glucosidase (family GH31 glycosyl hydrolase)